MTPERFAIAVVLLTVLWALFVSIGAFVGTEERERIRAELVYHLLAIEMFLWLITLVLIGIYACLCGR